MRLKSKIPNITNLVSTTALTAVENKLPNFSILVKEADYNTKKLVDLQKKLLLIMIMIGIFLLKNLIG